MPGEAAVHADGTEAKKDRLKPRGMMVLANIMMFIGSCSTSDSLE